MATVLVVDDDPDHRFLIERALTAVGHTVKAVERGADAVDALAANDGIDLMLLDYRLPDMTGLEVLRHVSDGDGPSVVMVTAMGSEHVAVEAMRSGAVDYLVKDANYLRVLPQVIERAFKVHDISRRARLLERITLLLNSSLDRVSVSREILRGARQVLRADACALYMLDTDGEVEEMLDGVAPGTAEAVRADARAILTGVEPKTDGGDRLLVPLPEHEGRRLGVLAVLNETAREFAPEELRLAETLAAFAGMALANAARLELERSLVSELQQTLDLRRSMVMSLSHELRTPLTCIRGFAETMLGHWNGLDDKTRHDAVETISQHADDLQRLVEQLLDFGALETGRLEAVSEPVDLEREISTSLAGLAPMIGERAVEVDVDDVMVIADARLLRRTLANLVSNAVKYSGPQGRIAIVGRAEASAARITVADSGIGLSAEEAAHVFEPFWRARSAVTSAMRGSGIGLALVQEYVRVMGGEVSVASVPGQGSRFSFTLPLASVPAASSSSSSSSSS